jgi:hypothetical protein
MIDTEKLIWELIANKPSFDVQDTNYDVATIENAITVIEKYAEIKKIVDNWNSSDIVDDENEISQYFQQILDVFSEVNSYEDNN